MPDEKKETPTGGPWHRNRALRPAALLLVVAGVLAALLVFAPTYAARWYVAQVLDDAGASAEGLGTLDVDIFEGEASLGPFRFWAGDAPHGELESASFKLSYGALFDQNLLFRNMLVAGLDVQVSRGPEGSILVNGIDVNQLAPAQESQQTPQEQTAESWGIGFDKFTLWDAEIEVEPPTGEPVALEIDRLTADNLNTWESNQQGELSMTAAVNGIPVDVSGTASLRPAVTAADLQIASGPADVDTLVRLLQVQGVEPARGRLTLDLDQKVAIAEDGLVRIATSGTAEVSNALLSYETGLEAAVEEAHLGLDIEASWAESDDTATLDGTLTSDLESIRLSDGTGAGLRVQSAEVALSDLQLTTLADGAIRLAAHTQVDAEDIALSGPVDVSAGALAVNLAPVVLKGGQQKQTATAEGTVAITGLEASAGETELESDRLSFDLAGLMVDVTPDGNLTLSGKPEVSMANPALSGNVEASANTIALDLSSLDVSTAGAASAVAAEGMVSAQGLQVPAPGTSVTAGTASLDLRGIRMQIRQDGTQVQGAPQLSLQNVQATGDNKGSFASLDLNFSSLRADAGGQQTAVDAAGSATIRSADLRLPRAGDEPALSTSFESLTVAFPEFSAEVGGPGSPQWQGRLDVEVSGLSGTAGEGDLARAQVGRIGVEDVRVGDEMNVAAQEVAVADANVVVTRRFIEELASQEPGEDEAGGEVRVGRFHTVGDAEIRFRDRMIDPTVQSQLNIEQFQVQDLNTARPGQEAQVRLIAVLNEFTDVRVSGQASPFAEQPEFDLDATVQSFDLPEVSPYAREYAGVRVQSGQLSAGAEATADEGELDATVDLTVSRLGIEKMADGKLSGIPIKTGLALLEGPDGKISLTIPISGGLDDLEFDFSQAINQALGGAVRSAIGTGFKVLFPPAGIVSLLRGKNEAEVEDVPFEPGSADLTRQARTTVENYAELLARRPKLTLEVCGRATAADLDAYGEQAVAVEEPRPGADAATGALRDLAVERTRTVRRYLISQAGLTSERVTACRPQVNPESSGAPRAEVSL